MLFSILGHTRERNLRFKGGNYPGGVSDASVCVNIQIFA